MARSTRRVCRDCGFYLPLTGSLGTMFGVCGNELAADGTSWNALRVWRAFGHPGARGHRFAALRPYDDGVLDPTEPD